MAIDRGKQFEYAIMKSAYSNIKDPTLSEQQVINLAAMKGVEQTVQDVADEMMYKIQGNFPSQQFDKSFRQLGGGSPEPKTDVLFIKNGKKHKCSMKYGGAYQLSSAGIEGTVKVLNNVLFKVAQKGGMGGAQIKEVAAVLDELSQTFEGPKKQEQPIMKRMIEKAKKEGGLNERLQNILGSRRQPEGDKLFMVFKLELVRESLTGESLFGMGSDRTANYVMTDSQLKPIDAKLVNEIAKTTSVDIRLKGRGKTKEGIRLNEAVIRIEPAN